MRRLCVEGAVGRRVSKRLADVVPVPGYGNMLTKTEMPPLSNWMREGSIRIHEATRGGFDSGEPGDWVIRLLGEHLEAYSGALYLFSVDSDTLRMVSRYPPDHGCEPCSEIRIGEGVVGHAARDRQPLLIDQVPEGYCTIQSVLGQSIVYPLVHRDHLVGVIELTSVSPWDERGVNFLSSVEEVICVALRSPDGWPESTSSLTSARKSMRQLLPQDP